MVDIHNFDDKLPHFIALQSLEIIKLYSEWSYGVSAYTRVKKITKYFIFYTEILILESHVETVIS